MLQTQAKEESTRRREGLRKPPAIVLTDKPQDAKAANEEGPALRKETSENPKNAVVYMNPANAIVFKLNQQQAKAGSA